MGIQNKDGALYFATGVDNTGLYSGKREAIGIIKAMAGEITSFDVFGGIGISAGIAFAKAAQSAYDFEKQFQQSMKEVATLSSGIKGSLTDYMNQVMDITRKVPVLANDAAKALYQIVSAGHDGADGMKILEVSAKAAIGGVTDTATAADGITTLLNAYKLDVSEAEKISDQLFTTVKLGKTSFGELGKSIAQVAPIAASYGVETDQVLAAVATLTKQGTPTAQAMTQIRASIIAASKVLGDGAFDGRTYQEALAEVARQAGGSESKLRELVPEVEAVNAVLGLTGINVKEAAGHLAEMQNATGAAEAAFQEMASSAENQMKLLQNNITSALRPMGEAILKEVSDIASSFNEAFANGDVQESMKTLGALIVTVTGAFVGYKGSIVATTAAKTAYHAITSWIIKQKSIEAANLVLIKGMYATEAAAVAKNAAMHTLLTNALKAQFAASMKAISATLANPYVLAAIAVAGLGYAIYKLATAETDAEKAARKHREEQERFQKTIDERKQKIEELIQVIQDETETEYSQIKAYEELQKLSPALTDAYKREKLAILDTTEAQKILNKEIEGLNYEHIVTEIDRITKSMRTYQQQSGLRGNALENKSYYQSLKKELELYKSELDEYNRLKKQAEEDSKPVEVKLLEAQNNRDQIIQEFAAAKLLLETEQRKIQESGFGIIPIDVQIRFNNAQEALKNIDNTISPLKQSQDAPEVQNKAYWEKLKKEAQEKLDALTDIEAAGKKGAELKVKISEYDKKINTFSSSTSKQDSEAEKLRKEQEKLNEQIVKNDLSLNAERLAILEDGREKRLLQSKQEWEEKKAQLDKEYKERIAADKKNNITTPQAVTDTYKARLAINDKVKEKRDANINKEADAEFIEHQKELTSVLLTEEEARQKAIKERYDKERQWAKEKLDGGDISQEQYKEYTVAIDKAESQEILKELFDEYQDYADKRLAIEEKFNKDIAVLDEQRKIAVKNGDAKQIGQIDRAKTQATKDKGKALMGADYEQLKKSPEYVRAFENLKRTSTETLSSLLGQLENAKHAAAEVLSPDELREYTSTIQDIMDELNSRNPFKALADRKKELAEAEKELAEAKKNLDTVNSGGQIVTGTSYNKDTGKIEKTYLSATEALKQYNRAKDKTVEIDTEVHDAEREVSDVMGELFDSIKNVGNAIGGEAGEIIGIIGDIGQFALMAMNGVESASVTASSAVQAVEKASVILAIIGAAIQIATKIASLFKGTDYMAEFRKEMEKLNYELELAKLNAEISTDKNSIFGDDLWANAVKNIDRAQEALGRYNETLDDISNRKKYTGFSAMMAEAMGLKNTYDSLGESIADMQVKIRHKTWFRSAKYSSLKDAVPELFNDDGSVNQTALEEFIGSDTFGKLSEENQQYLQKMSDYWKSYQDAVEKVKDYLTDIFGDLGNTMNDALVDAFANGTDAARVFTDSVSNMLETLAKQMVYAATLGPLMERYQEKLLGVMNNTSLSKEEQFKQMAGVMEGLVDEAIAEQGYANELLEKLQQAAAEKGFDIFVPESVTKAKEALESFVSSMQSAFTSLDVTAKDVSDNIYDYFRQAMINALYEKEYKGKMEELYKTFEELSKDGLSEGDMAQLGSQIDQYIEQMMKGVEDVNGLFADKLKDAEDIKSFVDNVKSAMSSIEATAEDVTDNIFEYIRQQMIDKMFADTFQPQIEAFYKKVQEAMSDGDITDSERDALRAEAEKLANDITAAKDILSDTLGITEQNLKKELEEEFKSFSDGVLNSLYDAEVTAEAVTKNISDSMRKELIEAMYIEQYEPRIKAIWEKWKEYSEDGLVTDEERANIKNDIDELSKEVADAAKEISDAWKDSGAEVKKAFDSFSDSIKSVLYDAETTAEDVANNIYKFMRNALVDSMFAAQLQPQIQAWYDQYNKFMEDGAIDTVERKTLDEMIAEIQKAGMEIVDVANGLFPSLDTGAIKHADEAEQEWESFSDGILNSLYDIEATAEDISDDMSEYMRKALIKAMYIENFKPQMQKWYNAWKSAMGDDNLTSEEKQMLDSMKQTMVDDMKKEVDAINQFFGSMFSQQASSKGFEGLSQDTGEELNGRFTALQIAGEEIRNQAVQQTGLLSSIDKRLSLLDITNDDIPALMSGMPNFADKTRGIITNSYQPQANVVFPTEDIKVLAEKVSSMERIVDEMRTFQVEGNMARRDILENSAILAKNSPKILAGTDEIKRNLKNL